MSRIEKRKKESNRWKNSFFTLLIFNGIIVLLLLCLFFWPMRDVEFATSPPSETQESTEFIVRTTKENLNELVNAYITELTAGSSLHYQIDLDEDVHLIGELPVFSTTVPLSMRFEPLVEDNGDIILKQRSISLGLLELPNQRIMEYVERYLPMPEWVAVNPEEEEIYIAVTDIDIKSNFQVAVETIDLEADNIAIRINVPYESLKLGSVNLTD